MLKVLFIHPDQKIFQMYQPHLTPHFSVDSAANGLIALRKMRISRPSVVISDYKLPLLSGLSLLKFMRNRQNLALTPFIFFTDYPDASEALSFGANDWIIKAQANPDLVVEKIYYHIRQNRYAI